MSVYLYGVTARRSGQRGLPSLGAGVGEVAAPVRLFGYREVAAVVSPLESDGVIGEAGGTRALRRDIQRHGEVLNTLAATTTVLPARFGVIFPEEHALIDGLLEPEYDSLLADLKRLDGQVEITLRVEYVEDELLAQIAREQPQVFARAGRTYQEKIELGRRVAAAIAAERQIDGAWLLERLRPLLTDIVVNSESPDLTVLRAALLLPRGRIKHLDRELSHLQKEAGSRMNLACLGPLPPYSFVHMRVHAGELLQP